MKKFLTTFSFFLVLVFFATNAVSVNAETFTDSFQSYNFGDLNNQDGWEVTNHDGNSDNMVTVSKTDTGEGTKYVEITNNDSIIVSRNITPVDAGIFQVQMRHNKLGLFYLYALTSDAGGQLLFSIQFTESNGILLEEGDKQITLLPDYTADQWYLFTIDFDNTKEEHGTFKIKIDDGSYSEYEYVNSVSDAFDFAQMVFGSESSNGTAMSAFGDITPTSGIVELVAPEAAEENATTTSITSDLIDGQTVTAPIDGVVVSGTTTTSITSDLIDEQTVTAPIDGVVVTESPQTTDAGIVSSQTAAVAEATGAGGGILDAVVETLLDIIGVDDTTEETPIPEASTESNVEGTPAPSSVTGDTNTNGTTTTEF